MDILLQDGVYHLSGRMDEFSEFESLRASASPLKLNIGQVASINSMGVRKFLAFALSWSPRKMEFYEATPEFIGNVNVIPQLLGKEASDEAIKTFYVPYYCDSCKRTESELWDVAKLTLTKSGEVQVHAKVCGKCGEQMELDAEPSEYFIFLSIKRS